jgi:hypothetical protein
MGSLFPSIHDRWNYAATYGVTNRAELQMLCGVKCQSPIPNPQSPIPNPQSPIHNPQSPIPNPQSPIHNPQSTHWRSHANQGAGCSQSKIESSAICRRSAVGLQFKRGSADSILDILSLSCRRHSGLLIVPVCLPGIGSIRSSKGGFCGHRP